MQEYIKNFEKLFLDRKQRIQAKDFLEAERFHSREKNIIDELVAQNYLQECGDKWYSLGEAALNLLKKETYRWEALKQEKLFSEKQFQQEITQYLKNIFFHSSSSLDAREVFEIDRVDSRKKEFIAELVEEGYFQECPEDNKSYQIGEKGWSLLQENQENWLLLVHKKQQKQKIKWRDFLKYIEINGSLTADIKKQYSYELDSGLSEEYIENQGQKYSLTEKGQHFLYTLRPVAEVLLDLQNEYNLFKNKYTNIEKIIIQQHENLVKNLESIDENLTQKFINLNNELEKTKQEFVNIQTFVRDSEIACKWKQDINEKIEKTINNYHLQQENLKTTWLNEQKKSLELHNDTLLKQKDKITEQQSSIAKEVQQLEQLYQNIYDILQKENTQKIELTNHITNKKVRDASPIEKQDSEKIENLENKVPQVKNKQDTNIEKQKEQSINSEQHNEFLEEDFASEMKSKNISYDDKIKELEEKFNESINRTYKKIDNGDHSIDNDVENDEIRDRDDAENDEIRDRDDAENKEYSKDIEIDTLDFNNYNDYQDFESESSYINDDMEEDASEQNILEEIQKYYKLTYFRHRGSLKLNFLLDHLENELEMNREDAKLQIKKLYKEGFITLDTTKDVDKYQMDNIICDGTNFYYALHIETER